MKLPCRIQPDLSDLRSLTQRVRSLTLLAVSFFALYFRAKKTEPDTLRKVHLGETPASMLYRSG